MAHRADPPGEGGVHVLPEHAPGRRAEAGGEEDAELPGRRGRAAGGRAGRLWRRRRRHDDGPGPQDRQRRRGGGRGRDDGGGVRPGQERRERGRGAAGGRRLEGRRSRAGDHLGQRQWTSTPTATATTFDIGPTVELVPANGHANGNGNGHHSLPRTGYGDEAPEPQQSLFSWAEFMAEEPVKPRGRKTQAPSLSLFAWAVEQEREEEPVGAGR